MSMREKRAEELDALMKMFMSKGWTHIETDLGMSLEQLMRSSWMELETGEQFMARKGEIMALARVLSYKPTVQNELDNFDDAKFDDEPDEGKNDLED